MPLPDTVQIGPVRYSVTADRTRFFEAIEAENDTFYGRIQYSTCEIVLDPKPTDDHKRVTLMHEVLHGIISGADRGKAPDETQVSLMAMMLVDTLRRNPALVAYLTEVGDAQGA